MRQINEIIVHCADTPPSWGANMTPEQQRDEIKRWHMEERRWSDIGYHYIITRNGVVAKGRPIEKIGAHVKGHNTGTVGICLIGGKGSSANDTFLDHFTPAQDAALRRLIDELKYRFPVIKKVSGHNDYAAKACPGFKVGEWIDRGMTAKRTIGQSTTVRASAVQIMSGAGSIAGAIGMFGEKAQIAAIVIGGVVILAGLWIMRERLRAWAYGWH